MIAKLISGQAQTLPGSLPQKGHPLTGQLAQMQAEILGRWHQISCNTQSETHTGKYMLGSKQKHRTSKA